MAEGKISNTMLSYVGMIIHSTVLDTQAKVIQTYGGDTWLQHSGYFLRGASSGVVAGSTSKTGGNDNSIIPYHNHGFTNPTYKTEGAGAHSHQLPWYTGHGNKRGFNTWADTNSIDYSSVTSSVANHAHTVTLTANGSVSYAGTNGSTTNANIPNYKSVYIWERIA